MCFISYNLNIYILEDKYGQNRVICLSDSILILFCLPIKNRKLD